MFAEYFTEYSEFHTTIFREFSQKITSCFEQDFSMSREWNFTSGAQSVATALII